MIIKNLKFKIKNCHKGFTLIELLIVIAIIGVLATLLMVNFIGVRQRARDAQRKSDLRQVQSALEIYRSDNSSYPNGNTKVDEIFSCPPSAPPAACTGSTNCFGNSPSCSSVYMKTLPIDPGGAGSFNGGSYYYQSSGTTYTLGACLENKGDSQGTATNPNSTINGCSSGTYYVTQ